MSGLQIFGLICIIFIAAAIVYFTKDDIQKITK